MSGILEKFSLQDKVIVVTGGTGVLGKSFVEALAEAGAKIVVLGRNKERAIQRVAEATNIGAEAFYILTDVLDENALHKAKDEILAKWGKIDGLINAAGGNIPGATIGEQQNLFESNVQDTIKAIELNLYGTIIPTHIFGKVIAESGKGSIINISSLAASRPLTRVLGYTVAKHGIDGYTKWMSTELAIRYGDKVRVNAIAPGVFLTDQNHKLLINEDGSYSDRAQKFINGTPYKRFGNPDELKGAIVYLLSDASAFVTGEILFIDGGFNSWCGV
ncbi:SDR family oxidoreductase [Sphingobacterium rhinopitheci]|uniref:SDR family oxidoreductase n=1 Tax=Sphingobacterium rhinopitheci TaxID=2781960 RepID=UPI001F52454E|nr:SDR family oxidoreductase [Sphingobacterium rhinopitheci]MCI0921393.1 SDR family oxidoreductase [Sphingobacterium rhinopitheci]